MASKPKPKSKPVAKRRGYDAGGGVSFGSGFASGMSSGMGMLRAARDLRNAFKSSDPPEAKKPDDPAKEVTQVNKPIESEPVGSGGSSMNDAPFVGGWGDGGMKRGGKIRHTSGPRIGKDDGLIPAQRGEYVIRKSAVNKLGTRALAQVNKGKIPTKAGKR